MDANPAQKTITLSLIDKVTAHELCYTQKLRFVVKVRVRKHQW